MLASEVLRLQTQWAKELKRVDRNRQSGRTTSLLKYAHSINGMYVTLHLEMKRGVRSLYPEFDTDRVATVSNAFAKWKELGRPLIIVDHVVWEYGSSTDIYLLTRFLQWAAEHPAEAGE